MTPQKYELIDSPSAMLAAMADLRRTRSLAVDMEMENNCHHYGLHISIIQVSIPCGRNFIFDLLSGLDPRPLGEMLTDPAVEIIMHDADFDKRASYEIYRWKIKGLFDTKVAAQFCGFKAYGLAALLGGILNVETNKKFQRIDWMKRPLRPDALEYAAGDVAHLFKIKEHLVRRLEDLGRLGWASEEFRRIEEDIGASPTVPPHLRIKKTSRLSPRHMAVLAALVRFRDGLARKLDKPAQFVVRNELLVELAVNPPETEEAVMNLRGVHPALRGRKAAEGLLNAAAEGRAAPEEPHARRDDRPRPERGAEERFRQMQEWRSARGLELDIEPHLLLSNDILRWAAAHPGKPIPSETEGQLRRWQRALLWEEFQERFLRPAAPGPCHHVENTEPVRTSDHHMQLPAGFAHASPKLFVAKKRK